MNLDVDPLVFLLDVDGVVVPSVRAKYVTHMVISSGPSVIIWHLLLLLK
jgi:hypothetical protein